MSAAVEHDGGLRVGDYITFKSVKHDCFLAGEGILLEDLIISDSLKNLDEAVFCVHLQRQYSASIELDDFMLGYAEKVAQHNANPLNEIKLPENINDFDDPQTHKYLHALRRCLYNEHVLNESYMKQKVGKPVAFGDIVQLFHVRSQKYLTITNDQLAKEERENMRIELNSKGSPFSWVQLSPRYKIDKDGDKILSNTEIYLRVAERANEFVHCSERELLPKVMNPRMNIKNSRPGTYMDPVTETVTETETEATAIIADHGTAGNSGSNSVNVSALNTPVASRPISAGGTAAVSGGAYSDLEGDSSALFQYLNNENRPHVREINCSLESSSWKLSIFQGSLDRADKYMLLSSQIVTIQDPETKSLLTIGAKKLESLDDEPRVTNAGAEIANTINNMDGTVTNLDAYGEVIEEPEWDPNHGYFHEHGDIILAPQTTMHINGNTLWLLESVTDPGGPVLWKTQKVRFRHVNSDVYLVLNILEELDDDSGEMIEKYFYSTSVDKFNPGTEFNLHELYAARTQLGNMKPLQISHDGIFMTRGTVIDTGDDDNVNLCYMLCGGQDKDASCSLILNRFSGLSAEQEEEEAEEAAAASGEGARGESGSGGDGGKVKKEGADEYDVGTTMKEPLDVHVGIAARSYCQNFLDVTVIPEQSDRVSTIWPGADSIDMDFFVMLMQKINWFLQGFPISSTNINPDVDKADPKVRNKRQYQLQEQKLLEVILRLINKLIPISTDAGVIANLLKLNKPVTEDRMNCNRMGQAVLKLCFDIIYSAIQDHPSNQMYIADFLPVLLAHLSVQPLAGKCVTEMLNKNMELQETKIGKREITIFINQLKEARMNAMYLGLLQSCCSCQGEGVDGNQRLVAMMLFDHDNDMVIQVHPDYTQLNKIDWNIKPGNLYIPSTAQPGSPVMGERLYTRGLPLLSLTWTTNSIDYSPLGLFGKLSVPMSELYKKLPPPLPLAKGAVKNSKLLAKKAISNEQKKAVADYFIAEMYLGAEMLMDRNYISLQKLAPLFSFDVLMTMLKMDVDDNLKAAAARLLMYLYIDTDPQLESTIPCLTRPWSEIALHASPKLPYVDPAREYLFGLVQHMLSEHIAGLRGTRWTRLSLSMFEVLRMLVSFNFYGTMGRMKSIIEPLILALDRRSIDYSKEAVAAATVAVNAAAVAATNGGNMVGNPGSTGPMKDPFGNPMKDATGAIGSMNMNETVPNSRDTGLHEVVAGSAANYAPLEIDEAELPPKEPEPVVDLSTRCRNWAEDVVTYWQVFDWYRFMVRAKTIVDSLTVLVAILILVIIAVGITIYETITSITHLWSDILQLCILGVFIVEVSIRFITYLYLYKSTQRFFRSPYNLIDIAVIGIDVIFLCIPANSGGAGKYARVLRLLRLIRLARLMRAARVISMVVEVAAVQPDKLIAATRYTKSPIYELDAMVQAIEILLLCQANIEDRNVSLLLRYFYQWECGEEKRTPVELFNVVMEEANELSLHSDQSDDVFIDLIMFVHPPLVQRVLDVLMAHYTRRRVLLAHAGNVQLLVSARRERQYKQIDQMLFQLDLNVETQELWGDLESESDHATNQQTIDMLKELTEALLLRRNVIDVDQIGARQNPDTEIQHLLRNLGCLSTCLKVIKLLDGVEEEEGDEEGSGGGGGLGEAAKNVLYLVSLANTLLYWFFLDNPINQAIGYEKLDVWIDILSQNVRADPVIHAIFRGNEELMTKLPHSYINLMVEKICKDGRLPCYLTLLSSVTNVGEKNITNNQYDVAKQICDAAKQDKLDSYLVPVTSEKYLEKRSMMIPFRKTKNVDIESLPVALQYHLKYLEVVACCTVGTINTTIVEAKIQAAFNHVDIVEAMLDNECMLIVKIYLAMFYFNGIVDVEMEIPGLEHTACVWKLLATYKDVFSAVLQELETADKLGGIHHDEVDKHMLEYGVICMQILSVFFEKYYDPMMFAMMEDREDDDTGKFVVMTGAEGDELFLQLFARLKALYTQNSRFISKAYRQLIVTAMYALADFTVAVNEKELQGIPKAMRSNTADAAAKVGSGSFDQPTDELEDAGSVDADCLLEHKIQRKFQEFMGAIQSSQEIKDAEASESIPFIDVFSKLPMALDKTTNSDVRYEGFIRKLVSHTRSKIEHKIGVEKRLDAQCTKTSIWLIQALRTIIEKIWGMDIFQRDDDGGEEEDEACRETVDTYNHCGVMTLCLDLISVGIDPVLQTTCSYLGVAMLLREGGNQEVQETIYNHLSKNDSELFFKQVSATIKGLVAWHAWRATTEQEAEARAELEAKGHGDNSADGRTTSASASAAAVASANALSAVDAEGGDGDDDGEEESEVELPPELIMLRFLQLFAEGHYKPNQDIMRVQPNNHVSINLLDDFVNYFKVLSQWPCRTNTVAAITVTNVILEIIQGPCEKNQEYLALNTELIETLNRVLRSKTIRDCDEDEEIELKQICIDIFQGLLEGQSLKGAVYERVFAVIHFDVVQTLSKSTKVLEEEALQEMDELPDEDAPPPPAIEISEAEAVLKTECMVLLQMLANYRPSQRRELLGLDQNLSADDKGAAEADDEDCGVIEVVWRGEVVRKFFHIPLVCKHLAKSSKDQFVFSVDRSNAENQMLDFIERGRVMYMEVKHQEVLIEMGLDKVFNRTNQEYSTWIAFFLCCLINLLFLINYTLTAERVPVVNASAITAINALNIMQLLVATFTFVMFLVVRAPVKYQVNEAEGLSRLDNLFHTATDFMTMYYFGYVIVAMLGLVHHDFWSTFLLLDLLMKNATARDVVKAVYNPIRALTMSVLLLVLVVYAYTNVVFFVYRTDLANASDYCYTLWDCFKSLFDIGLRHAHFITDVMYTTYGNRSFLDWFGFIGIKTLLMNLVFGIIIESFKQLREENDEKVDKINNSCFICGIDKETFDRASDGVDGFKRHIKKDHLLWNYWYFFVFIWEQDKDDDDGLELYIRACMERYDVCWFPIGKALVLSDKINEDEALNAELANYVRESKKALTTKIQNYQQEVGSTLEAIATALKNDSLAPGGHVMRKVTKQIRQFTSMGAITDIGGNVVEAGDSVAGSGAEVDSFNVQGTVTPLGRGFNFGSPGGGSAVSSRDPGGRPLPVQERNYLDTKALALSGDQILQIINISLLEITLFAHTLNKITPNLSALYKENPQRFLQQLTCRIISDMGVFSVAPKIGVGVKLSQNASVDGHVVSLMNLPLVVGETPMSALHGKICTINIVHQASTAGGNSFGLDAAVVDSSVAYNHIVATVEVPLLELLYGNDSMMDFYFSAYRPLAKNKQQPSSPQQKQRQLSKGLNYSFITLSTRTDEISAADLEDEADAPPSGVEALRHKQDSVYWNSSSVDDDENEVEDVAVIDGSHSVEFEVNDGREDE